MGGESKGAITRDCKRKENAGGDNEQAATSTRSTSGKRVVSSTLFREACAWGVYAYCATVLYVLWSERALVCASV